MDPTPKYPQFENCELDGKGMLLLSFGQKKSPQIALRGPFTFFLLTQFLYLHVIQFHWGRSTEYFHGHFQFLLFFIHLFDDAIEVIERSLYNFDCLANNEWFADRSGVQVKRTEIRSLGARELEDKISDINSTTASFMSPGSSRSI